MTNKKFDQDKPIDYKTRRYAKGTKQNYIIENVLILRFFTISL